MATRYIELDSTDFELFLLDKGFERSVQCNEIVYSRAHNSSKYLRVKVYTSISSENSSVRECGSDCIRVCAAYNKGEKSFGVSRQPRIYRTGSQDAIKERTYDRMKLAYERSTEWLKNNRWAIC